MNIMHNKTEKFITQLRHATHGEQCNTAKLQSIQVGYQLISQPKLDKLSSSRNVTAEVRSDVHSFPRSNADVCAT